MTAEALKALRADLRIIKREMKAAGLKRTSCFNGGLSSEAYAFNSRCFALETQIKRLEQQT